MISYAASALLSQWVKSAVPGNTAASEQIGFAFQPAEAVLLIRPKGEAFATVRLLEQFALPAIKRLIVLENLELVRTVGQGLARIDQWMVANGFLREEALAYLQAPRDNTSLSGHAISGRNCLPPAGDLPEN